MLTCVYTTLSDTPTRGPVVTITQSQPDSQPIILGVVISVVFVLIVAVVLLVLWTCRGKVQYNVSARVM